MNSIYLYNGNFFCLLDLIYKIIDTKNNPQDIKSEDNYIMGLFDNVINLKLNDRIDNHDLPNYIFHIVYYIYLSEDKHKELVIFYFIKNYLKYKNNILNYRNLKCVNEALRITKYVGSEAHKLKGFLRFKKMKNNFYYACVSPTNNVLSILANHFAKRLKNENWLIEDTKRGQYAFYDKKKITYLDKEDVKNLNLEYSHDEEDMQKLWKAFFKTIAIKERKNLKCQMNFMPKKYWGNILEME